MHLNYGRRGKDSEASRCSPHTNAQSPNLIAQRAHLLNEERLGRKGKVWGEVRRPDQPPVPRVALQILLPPQAAFMRVNKSQNDRVIFR